MSVMREVAKFQLSMSNVINGQNGKMSYMGKVVEMKDVYIKL